MPNPKKNLRLSDNPFSEFRDTATGRRVHVKGMPHLSPSQRKILKKRFDATAEYLRTGNRQPMIVWKSEQELVKS